MAQLTKIQPFKNLHLHLALIVGIIFSIVACASEQEVPIVENSLQQGNRFIVQLNAATSHAPLTDQQRNIKLQQWEKASKLKLTLVPPTNQQRWVIIVNSKTTTDAQRQKVQQLIDVVSQDASVKYIEEDKIMNITPPSIPTQQRLIPLPQKN